MSQRTKVRVRVMTFAVFGLVAALGPGRGQAQWSGPAGENPGSSFHYSFTVSGILEESWRIENSSSPYFWLTSGARLLIANGIGSTISGALPVGDPWQQRYRANNPLDSDQGRHPQNLFRLLTRSRWGDAQQQIYLRVRRDQLSSSPNRQASNGLFLMSRYASQDTLYYAGLRVDGTAIIKRKRAGRYTTLASHKLIDLPYQRGANANLIPKNTWIGLRSEVRNSADGSVRIRLWLDLASNVWILVLQVRDLEGDGPLAIREPGHLGVRTDFMDVQFRDYRIDSLR